MDSDTKKRSLQQFQQSIYQQDTYNSQEIEKKNFKYKNLHNIDFFLQDNNKNEKVNENEQRQQLEQKHEEKKGNAPKRSLILGLFTCKGFDDEIFLPLVQSGVNVKIICNKEKEHDKDTFIETNYKGFQNWTLIYKQVNFGCFHPKLWILKFPNFIRIVIGSGNLQIPHWYQDFLELDLDNYLFEDINIKLVPSMRGKFIQNQQNKYGFQRVKQILIENPPVQFYKNPIVTAMFIFPSKNYIEKETYEGVSYSDCLFFSKKIYFSENFAIQTMMDYLPSPGNEGSYPHLKCFIITDEDKKITDDTVIYFGRFSGNEVKYNKQSAILISNLSI
ncbi:hypothetical protein PPERSA_01685 [Pseudocohnilembus persalinus]|uniref:Uncharacterized protein n=1 Tax=Pseudocohnilembus persalinus TaxID=266149 RepID=A0A0V0R0U1_PSEPJ|nr:hypothetical protein PPERSA_01685 [Pseudocohnilembus persalinus]|eukprot:KRX08140.1 hypothetical protein PPERSA_01685 [Pseudocohnilembus persalinus]